MTVFATVEPQLPVGGRCRSVAMVAKQWEKTDPRPEGFIAISSVDPTIKAPSKGGI